MVKKLYVKTYGCQMNVYDSGRMEDVLAPHGYLPIDNPDEADVVILNTCHIREKAAEKVYSELGRLNKIKEEKKSLGNRMSIVVGGCVGQAEGKEIISRAPFVDLVIGPQNYHRLPDLLVRSQNQGIVDIDFPSESKFDFLPEEIIRSKADTNVSSFLTIQEGCDKFCTFCVVPYTRGVEFSRSLVDLESESRRLVANGAKEITLLGQNVNAYHGLIGDGTNNELSLGQLIYHIAVIDGVERIRYTTSHPRDLALDLMIAHRDVAELMPFLHLPVQSGSDKILNAMNRGHTSRDFCDKVKELRTIRPDIAISSDFIVGFPGETDDDFNETMNLVKHIEFAQAFSFKYSERPGTPAAENKNQVPEETKRSRLLTLQHALSYSQEKFNAQMVGKTVSVLFERLGHEGGYLIGRAPHGQWVQAELSKDYLGCCIDVLITSAQKSSLRGSVVNRNIKISNEEYVA